LPPKSDLFQNHQKCPKSLVFEDIELRMPPLGLVWMSNVWAGGVAPCPRKNLPPPKKKIQNVIFVIYSRSPKKNLPPAPKKICPPPKKKKFQILFSSFSHVAPKNLSPPQQKKISKSKKCFLHQNFFRAKYFFKCKKCFFVKFFSEPKIIRGQYQGHPRSPKVKYRQ